MNILSDLVAIMDGLDIPVETGVFSGPAPDEYVVITPMADTFEVHAGDYPRFEMQEARVSLFSKGSYIKRKNQIVRAFLNGKVTVTARLYVGYEEDTEYYHYAIDVAKHYEYQEE